MHRRAALPVTFAVFLAAIVGLPSSLVVAQSAADGRGIAYELVVGGEPRPGMGSELRLYAVAFEPGAGLPVNAYPEAMVVTVEEGSLSLFAGPELSRGAIVVTAPDDGPVLIDEGGDCSSPCVAPPGQTLVLEAGSAVFHAADSQYAYQSRGGSACLLGAAIMAVGADFSWGWLGRAAAVPRSSALATEETLREANAKRGLLINICARKV